MLSPVAARKALVEPTLLALQATNAGLAKRYRTALRRSASDCCRHSLQVHIAWLLADAHMSGHLVPIISETHMASWHMQAIGPRRNTGDLPITYGVSDLTQRRQAPWTWDLIRLLTSISLSTLDKHRAQLLSDAVLSDHLRVMRAICVDDDSNARIDFTGLPEALKRAFERIAEPKAAAQAWKNMVTKRRFIKNKQSASLPMTLLKRVTTTLASDATVVDNTSHTDGSWLVLVEEHQHDDALRVLRLEQQAVISDQRCTAPGWWKRPYHLRDPFARRVSGEGIDYRLCTWSHCHHTLPVNSLDDGDVNRLGRLWGQLIATTQIEAIAADGRGSADIADEIAREHKQLTSHIKNTSQQLARFYCQLHRQLT